MSNGYNDMFRADPVGFARKFPLNNVNVRYLNEKTQLDFKEETEMAIEQGGAGEKGRTKVVKSSKGDYEKRIRNAKGALDQAKWGLFDLEDMDSDGGLQIYLRHASNDPGSEFRTKQTRFATRTVRDAAFAAYWCSYLSGGTQGEGIDNVPFVDLPKTNPNKKFMFTGAMQGCSLIITAPREDRDIIRVYHDAKHRKDTFKNEYVLLRLDYDRRETYDCANSDAQLRTKSMIAALGEAQYPTKQDIPRSVYGDIDQFLAIDLTKTAGGHSGTSITIANSFNFLFYNANRNRWTVVSQPQDFLPGRPHPGDKPGFFELSSTHQVRVEKFQTDSHKFGTLVKTAGNSRPVWVEEVPY